MPDLKRLSLLPATAVISSCGLSPSAPPNFEDAMECATLNALASDGEQNSEEAELAKKWLTYAARLPSQSGELVAARHDEDWASLQERLQDMSDTEILSFSTKAAFRCVGFEETYADELEGALAK